MIHFDQQTIDVQGTERVFKKVVHPGQKTRNFVDRNGVPVQMPTAANIVRNGTYVLSPRGVPTRKSTHCYSGQLTGPAKVNDWITSTEIPEIRSYSSMNSYGPSSAASLRHYTQVTPFPKKKTFGTGQQRSMKPTKSASNERFSSGTPSEKHNRESERWNPNLQSSRLEKEWSAVSQSRALKRSSEIVAHRVDRMYFMTGNKIPIHNRYHVADEELKRLKELSQTRTSSKQLRFSNRHRGDMYIPDPDRPKTISQVGDVSEVESDVSKMPAKSKSDKQLQAKKTGVEKRAALTPDSPKYVTKGPIQGWASEDSNVRKEEPSVQSEMIHTKSFHNDRANVEQQNLEVTSVNESNSSHSQDTNINRTGQDDSIIKTELKNDSDIVDQNGLKSEVTTDLDEGNVEQNSDTNREELGEVSIDNTFNNGLDTRETIDIVEAPEAAQTTDN
ncbi:hypothetical protein CHS0354_024713 [Potamilus streckersoni]|uniref:Uncharacterized protein n=1 Tax=Potamilus streckersoni TaxID=2493646 RepID=A0AAE0RX77_9BIVA|nr:hypothetical protein CHS0354_024713 [Potamilus streckersoni]